MKTIIRYLSLAALIVASATAQVAVKYNSSGQLTEPATLKVTGTKKISFESGGTLSAAGSVGTAGQLLQSQGPGVAPQWVTATGGAGDFNGPASSTDNALVRFDGAGGKTSQNSLAVLDDSGNLSGIISIPNVAIGASGPNLASSLNARGNLQAIQKPGTGAVTTSNSIAFGTSAWSAAVKFKCSTLKNYNGLIGSSADGLWAYLTNAGDLRVGIRPNFVTFASFAEADEWVDLVITNDGSTLTVYKNGKVFGTDTSVNTVGNYSSPVKGIGSTEEGGQSDSINGTITPPVLFNRALTAAQVKSLFESGVDSADVPAYPAGTAIAPTTGLWGSDGTCTLSNNAPTTISFTDTNIGYVFSATTLSGAFKNGQRSRATFTAANVTGPVTAGIYPAGSGGVPSAIINVVDGANTIDVGIGGTEGMLISFNWASAASADITDVKWVPAGAVLYPEPDAPGTGLVWRDVSGNGNHITLPASGVTWAKPAAPFLAKGTTTNDSAAAGNVGEYMDAGTAYANRVSLSNATVANVATLSLTAGDWDVEGFVGYEGVSATVDYVNGGASPISATLDNWYSQSAFFFTTKTFNHVNLIPTRRVSLAAPASVYMVASSGFSAGTIEAWGTIRARRVR